MYLATSGALNTMVSKESNSTSPAVAPDLARRRGRPQIARARVRQWSPRVEERFLVALTATCNVKVACAEVGLTPASAYNHRHRWVGFARRWDAAIEVGYAQIECALIEAAGNMLEGNLCRGEELAAVSPLGPMTIAQALQVLNMHKHAVHGLGKAPGKRWRPPKTLAELAPGIMRKLAPFIRQQERKARAAQSAG